ncbi:OmpA/MotB family protein [Nitrospina sp. 32_T5]|uniref:OmpA/MotB family protein n=1 Tax=unclassified Nitrospina TaxID=2638683 RepID=UPI003F9E78C8
MSDFLISMAKKNHDGEDQWISVSDVMAGLMMVFLLIAIIYMLETKGLAEEYANVREVIYHELKKEFSEDELKEWNARISRESLSVQFLAQTSFFDRGDKYLKDRFKKILNEFFPRFLKVLHTEKLSGHIRELRVEGHTSSEWYEIKNPNEKFLRNLVLSQGRAFQTTEHILSISQGLDVIPYGTQTHRDWLRAKIATIGFSSSHLIRNENGAENKDESRRVEFRVLTDAEKVIEEIRKFSS